MRVKRLKKQLKEAHVLIVLLREENRQMKGIITEHLNVCEETIQKSKNMVRRSLPLHRQVKNVYKQKGFYR
jgi:hypothetical protein